MSEQDTDIEFDFFEEPETHEAPSKQGLPRRRPRRPVRPPTGFTPLLRLVGLISFAILVVVLLVFWVRSCQGSGKHSSYLHYFQKVAAVAADSENIGRQLNAAVTTPGIKEADLEAKLNGLAQQQQQGVARAQSIVAPGPLRPQHQRVIEVLQLRVSGLRGLADAFRQTASGKPVPGPGAILAAQAERLVASDVVWDDLFKGPAVDELKRQGVSGVAVPDSTFLANHDLASRRSMAAVFQRIHGGRAAKGGAVVSGLHGDALIGVKALPGGQQLSSAVENTVRATTELAFAVTVQDTGSFQEVQVPVTLTIQQSPTPIRRKQVIDLINAGETKTVVFRDLGQLKFATKTSVKVDIAPVPGEKNLSNNSAEYPVIFSLP